MLTPKTTYVENIDRGRPCPQRVHSPTDVAAICGFTVSRRRVRMFSSILLRSTLRRNAVSHSARCFASRAPPPPSTSLPKAPRQEPLIESESQESTSPLGSEAQRESTAPEQPLSSLPSLDFAPGEEPRRERTGARSSKDSLSSIERKRRLYGRVSLGVLLFGLGVQTWYMGREFSEEDLKEFRLVRFRTCFSYRVIHATY